MAIDTFFNQFGEVVRIDRHPEKQAATVKFKDIESAEKAAQYAIQWREPIWGIPTVQLIYNVTGQNVRQNSLAQPGMPLSIQKTFSVPAPMTEKLPQMSDAERLKLQKLDEIMKKKELLRKNLL